MTSLTLNQLTLLVAVVDAGSFSEAAIEIGCTQSRISHAIAELERSLGARLLIRSRTGCVPTEAGLRVLQSARLILRLVTDLPTVAHGNSTVTAHLRIACFRSVGTQVLPTVLAALSRDYPDIHIDVDDSGDGYSDTIIKMVAQGRADIGIARQNEHSSLLQFGYLRDHYSAVVPATLPIGVTADWSTFQGLDYIQPQNADGATTLELCRAAGFLGKAARRMTNDLSILSLVARGLGFAILPRLAAYPLPTGTKLAGIPITLERNIAIYVGDNAAQLQATTILLRYLRDKVILRSTDVYQAGVITLDC